MKQLAEAPKAQENLKAKKLTDPKDVSLEEGLNSLNETPSIKDLINELQNLGKTSNYNVETQKKRGWEIQRDMIKSLNLQDKFPKSYRDNSVEADIMISLNQHDLMKFPNWEVGYNPDKTEATISVNSTDIADKRENGWVFIDYIFAQDGSYRVTKRERTNPPSEN